MICTPHQQTLICFRNSTPQKLLSFPHALATQIWKMQIKLYNKYERNILIWHSFRVYKSLHHNCNRIFMKYAEHVVQLRSSETLMSIKLRHDIVRFLSYQHYMSVSRTSEWRSFVRASTFFCTANTFPFTYMSTHTYVAKWWKQNLDIHRIHWSSQILRHEGDSGSQQWPKLLLQFVMLCI